MNKTNSQKSQKSQKSQPLEQSPTSSTGSETNAPEVPSDPVLALVEEMRKLMEPVAAFQRDSEHASEEDVRFMWEVKIIKGKSTLFGHITGTSTMSGLLSEHKLHMATELVSNEMIAKIADPVTSKFQQLINQIALAVVDDESLIDLPTRVSRNLPLTEVDLAMEAEIISSQGD